MGKKTTCFLIASALLIPMHSAVASIKEGSKCTKTGAVVIQSSLTFKCTVKGKTKVWIKIKGTSGVATSPSVVPTPSEQPSPTASPVPVANSEPLLPATFEDLIANPESMPYWAWKKSQNKIKTSNPVLPTVNVLLGPNTNKPTKLESFAVESVSKLYQGFKMPTSITMIYYTYPDISWAKSEFSKLSINPRGNEASSMCPALDNCVGALAENDYKGNGILLMTSRDRSIPGPDPTNGTLEAHEYFHNIQGTQFVGTQKESNSYCCIKGYLPHWFVEGPAEFTQATAIYNESFGKYKSERSFDIHDLIVNSEGKYTQEWIEKFLDVNSLAMWNEKGQNWRIYDVGFLATEAFVAIKGPDVILQLSRDVATGMSWDASFEKNFGINWTVAKPQLASAIKKQIG